MISCAFIGILMRLNGHVIVILKFNGSTIGKTNSYHDFDWDLTDHGNRKLISGTFFFHGDGMGWQYTKSKLPKR